VARNKKRRQDPKLADAEALQTTDTQKASQLPWSIEEKSENVHVIRMNHKSGWEQYILLASDVHFDNANCNRTLFKKHLDQALERQAPIIIHGDLLCLMQGKYDPRKSYDALLPQYKTDDYFGAILEDAIEFLDPYKHLIAVIGYGNHETSVLKRNNVDMIKMLCRNLGCFSGGGPVTKGVGKHNRRATIVRDVDIVVSGHIHESWVLENQQFSLNDQHKIGHKKQLHIQCPTYKDEIGTGAMGWANEKEFPPKPLGGWWLKFTVRSNKVYMSAERAE